jgi:hypothetical protein
MGSAFVLVLAATASASVALTQVSADPFTNSTSQHATEVEPDTFANGSTILAVYQAGRFFNGGASDIGYARSSNGGATWGVSGFLPGLTFNAGTFADPNSPYERVSDPSVAYDARHNVWMISSVPLLPDVTVPVIFVSRSTDGGAAFENPVQISAPPTKKVNLDKNWTVCDNTSSSPYYGNCYTEFDNFGEGDLVYMSTSSDGGLTWSTPVAPPGNPKGIAGQPLVQPSGTVLVPFRSLKGSISVFSSTTGGQSWTKETKVSRIIFHPQAGNLRSPPFPSAELDGAGNVYVAWADCRFRTKCASDDIVFSKSSDGVNWSDVARVPIDPATSSVDHFLPGLAVDRVTSGSGAHLALTYYFYPDAACTADTCELEAGYISSPDAGAHWGTPTTLTNAISLSDIAATSQGAMVGDYISTSFNDSGTASTVIAVGLAHSGSRFDEGMWAPSSPLTVASAAAATNVASSDGVQVMTGFGPGQAAVHSR